MCLVGDCDLKEHLDDAALLVGDLDLDNFNAAAAEVNSSSSAPSNFWLCLD
jgi:hypothetical protein